MFYLFLIVIGAVMAFVGQGQGGEDKPYILIVGFVLLMYGLYGTATKWVKDNPRQDEEDDSDEDEEETT
ncbi:hypothetical protein [Sinomicrobium sp.]